MRQVQVARKRAEAQRSSPVAFVSTRHDDGGFEVQIASAGAVIRVVPEQSVVAALANVGIEVPVSCEQGVCGTCITRVLEGTPHHRDLFLTGDERARGDQFTPCCSRAKSTWLVLEPVKQPHFTNTGKSCI